MVVSWMELNKIISLLVAYTAGGKKKVREEGVRSEKDFVMLIDDLTGSVVHKMRKKCDSWWGLFLVVGYKDRGGGVGSKTAN